MNVALKKLNPNIFADSGYDNIWEIFAWTTAAPIKFVFSSFFRAGPDCSVYQISSLWDQPFRFFANKSKTFKHICLKKYLYTNLGSFASPKKDLNDF